MKVKDALKVLAQADPESEIIHIYRDHSGHPISLSLGIALVDNYGMDYTQFWEDMDPKEYEDYGKVVKVVYAG